MKIKTGAIALLFSVLACAPAFSEFTAAEKAEIGKISSTLANTRQILYYAADGLRYSDATTKPLFTDLMERTWLMHGELRVAFNAILTLKSFSGESQSQLNDSASYRITTALAYLQRGLGGYRNGPVRSAIEALYAASAPLSGYADDNLDQAEATYATINLACCSFEDWKLADWPFFVRRASDGVGVHGDFETAKDRLAQGRSYLNEGMHEVINVVSKMPHTPELYWGSRLFAQAFRDMSKDLERVHLIAFGMDAGSAADPFTRLAVADEIALQPSALGFRGLLMFALRPLVLHLAQNGDGGTGAGANLAEAVERVGDAWFQGIDDWAWKSIEFPCLEPNAVGCFQ